MKLGEVEVALTSKRAGAVIWGFAGEAKTEGIMATIAERRRLRATILNAVVSQRHKCVAMR